jgi:membrane protein
MLFTAPKMHFVPAGFWARFWPRLRSAVKATYEDNCFGIAKGVAYSALLAFFPVVATLAAVLVQARASAISHTIASLLYEVVPPGTEDIVRDLFVVHGQRPKWLLVVATLLSAFAASGAMVTLSEGFQTIYRIPTGRSFLRERAIAVLLVFTSAVPVVAASALIVFGTRTEYRVVRRLGEVEFAGWVQLVGHLLRYGAAFASFVLVITLMYYFGPNRRQQFRNVVPGALLATLLWLPTTLAFGWYVGNVVNYNLLYGGVGAGLALLVWMYVLAVIVLLGCEYNAARERSL